MSRCQVTQGTDARFGDVFAFAGLQNGSNQRFDTSNLADTGLVAHVVACQVAQNSSGTS